MHNLKSRRYRKSDLDKVAELMKSHFEAALVPQRKLVFDWIATQNPAAKENCYLVIEDGHKIVAYEGRMPVDLMINGEIEKGYFFHDTLVHPDYRKKGLGLALVNELKNTWEGATGTFGVGLWMNEFTHEILRRRGYFELGAHYFIKPLNLEPTLTRITRSRLVARPIAAGVKALNGVNEAFVSRRGGSSLSVRKIARFDQRFDDFAQAISPKFKLIAVRHSRYLNWKYVDKPFADYALFSAERNGDLAGYIVLLPQRVGDIKVGVIVDILADPDDTRTISFLCQVAVNYFKRENAHFVSSVLTDKRFIRIFKRHLFFQRRKLAPVMLGNLDKSGAREMLKDINNWFLTCGDSDGFVWE